MRILCLLAAAALAHGQTIINGARTITGAFDASSSPMVRVRTGSGAPSSGSCSASGEVGSVYVRNDALTPNASLYVCSQISSGSYSWELVQGSGGSGGGGEWSGTLDFGAIPDMSCGQLSYTATGAATGAVVAQSLPPGIEPGLIAESWVSAADTVTVRVCNFSGASIDPSAGTFKAKQINGYLNGQATIDFTSIPDGSCVSGTITATGAATGDHVSAGWPPGLETGLVGVMSVTAADTVTVRLCNFSGDAVDPASATFKAAIIK